MKTSRWSFFICETSFYKKSKIKKVNMSFKISVNKSDNTNQMEKTFTLLIAKLG